MLLQVHNIAEAHFLISRFSLTFLDNKKNLFFRELQDSFEDDKSKILMILCASPDPKELHKTVSTLEYGAKAKCIIRPHPAHASTPRDKMNSEESSSMLNSRIVAMNQFIYKLQKENKQREKECNDAQTVLRLKEEELALVRAKLRLIEGQDAAAKKKEISLQGIEKTKIPKSELQMIEEKMLQQQQELHALKQRLREVGSEKLGARQPVQKDIIGGILLARLSQMSAGGDQPTVLDVKVLKEDILQQGQIWKETSTAGSRTSALKQEDVVRLSGFSEKAVPGTVFEEGDEEGKGKEKGAEEEVCKEVLEEESYKLDRMEQPLAEPDRTNCIQNIFRTNCIQNIFRLCRELVKKQNVESSAKHHMFGDDNKQLGQQLLEDENNQPAKQLFGGEKKGLLEVYNKWKSGDLIKGLKFPRTACLSDLRKLIEVYFKEASNKEQQQHQFSFLLLGGRQSSLPILCFHPIVLCYLLLLSMYLVNHHILSW
jgi:kinesin family protein 3/17/kinesin family protein 11